jgi:tetratricopeptide (TPR) repeat protein
MFIEGGIWYPAYLIYISVFAIIFLPPLLSAALVCLLVGQFFAFPFQGNYMLWVGLVAVGLPFKISSVPLYVFAPAMIIAFVLLLLAVIGGRIIRKQPKSWLDAYFKLRLANLMCPYLHYRMSAQIAANPRLFDKDSLRSEIDRLKKIKSLPYSADSARVRVAMLALLGEKEQAKKEVTEYLSEYPDDPHLLRTQAHLSGDGLQETLERIVSDLEVAPHKAWQAESIFWLELLAVSIKTDKRRAQQIADRMIKRHGEQARQAIQEFNKRLREQANKQTQVTQTTPLQQSATASEPIDETGESSDTVSIDPEVS